MKKISIAIFLTALLIPVSLIAQTKLQNSVSWQVTAIKDSRPMATTDQYTPNEPKRIILNLNEQEPHRNQVQTTILNSSLDAKHQQSAKYTVHFSSIKLRNNPKYELNATLSKQAFKNLQDLNKPIVISFNGPKYDGNNIAMQDLPNGQYVGDLELLVQHHW